MKKLSEKSFTRVTLALDIIGKIRSGPFAGFHDLTTVKHKIDLHDVIAVEESTDMRCVCDDPSVPQDNTNVCWKACDCLKNLFHIDRNVTISIKKNIPVKGGLAGGSANAATTLLLCNELWGLGCDADSLISIARNIGMDVPFYFSGNTAFDTEAGQTLTPIETSVRLAMVLVVPDFGVSTAEAYRAIDYSRIARDKGGTMEMVKALEKNDRQGVLGAMHNDFELSVFRDHPALGRIKKMLLDNGCPAAFMSGSGSTIVGILESPKDYDRMRAKIGMKSILAASL
jgi:4-diphosphocytidyl-2-C-methyl-D-erythritol kinase